MPVHIPPSNQVLSCPKTKKHCSCKAFQIWGNKEVPSSQMMPAGCLRDQVQRSCEDTTLLLPSLKAREADSQHRCGWGNGVTGQVTNIQMWGKDRLHHHLKTCMTQNCQAGTCCHTDTSWEVLRMEIPALETELSGRKHWIFCPTSPSELELLSQDYQQLSTPTPDFRAHSSLGPSFLLEQLAKCCSSLETWKFSPLVAVSAAAPSTRSQPSSQGNTQTRATVRFWCFISASGNLLHPPWDGPG